MTMTYDEIDIPRERAEPYIKECLSDGYALGEALLRLVDLGKGRFSTYCPQGAGAPTCAHLSEGGFTSLSESVQWLARAVQDALSSGTDRACVFENNAARSFDRFLAQNKSRIAFFGENVYHILTNQDGCLRAIERTINEATTGFLTIGCVGTCPVDLKEIPPRARIPSIGVLERLAAEATHIIVAAFDCEGFVVWKSTIDPSTR